MGWGVGGLWVSGFLRLAVAVSLMQNQLPARPTSSFPDPHSPPRAHQLAGMADAEPDAISNRTPLPDGRSSVVQMQGIAPESGDLESLILLLSLNPRTSCKMYGKLVQRPRHETLMRNFKPSSVPSKLPNSTDARASTRVFTLGCWQL